MLATLAAGAGPGSRSSGHSIAVALTTGLRPGIPRRRVLTAAVALLADRARTARRHMITTAA